jgi:hypothetical protein
MSNESKNQALPLSHQMLGLCQQLALLQMIGRVSKYLQDGVKKSQISPLVNALDDCKLAQSRNPRSATATFQDAITLFAEWERMLSADISPD